MWAHGAGWGHACVPVCDGAEDHHPEAQCKKTALALKRHHTESNSAAIQKAHGHSGRRRRVLGGGPRSLPGASGSEPVGRSLAVLGHIPQNELFFTLGGDEPQANA